MDILNILIALASIGFGGYGWLATSKTMEILNTASKPGSTMAESEVRAASGALFVGLGVGALLISTPVAYAMIGCAWGGAAVGRLTSIVLDGAEKKKIGFFASEVVVGAIGLANLL
ncbi:MAG: DUF4345 family protein [Paracoccaceae bacterium]